MQTMERSLRQKARPTVTEFLNYLNRSFNVLSNADNDDTLFNGTYSFC